MRVAHSYFLVQMPDLRRGLVSRPRAQQVAPRPEPITKLYAKMYERERLLPFAERLFAIYGDAFHLLLGGR